MRSLYKILPLFLLSISFFTSCEDEPEVGTTLFPEEEEVFGPKTFILEKRVKNNEKRKSIEEQKSGLVVEEEVDSFYVRCTNSLASDLRVKVAYDAAAAEAYNENAFVLSKEAFELLNSEVVIPAGQQVSSEPIKYRITKNKELEQMPELGVAAFKITEVSGGAFVSSNYNTFYVMVDKKYNYLDPDMSFDGLEPLPVDQYVVKFGENVVDKVSDNSLSSYIAANSLLELTVNLKKEVKFIGFSYQASSGFGGYSPQRAEILFSKDGENYTSYGLYIHGTAPWGNLVKVGMNEMTTKYVKFRFSEPYYKGYGPRFDTPLVSELRIYVK